MIPQDNVDQHNFIESDKTTFTSIKSLVEKLRVNIAVEIKYVLSRFYLPQLNSKSVSNYENYCYPKSIINQIFSVLLPDKMEEFYVPISEIIHLEKYLSSIVPEEPKQIYLADKKSIIDEIRNYLASNEPYSKKAIAYVRFQKYPKSKISRHIESNLIDPYGVIVAKLFLKISQSSGRRDSEDDHFEVILQNLTVFCPQINQNNTYLKIEIGAMFEICHLNEATVIVDQQLPYTTYNFNSPRFLINAQMNVNQKGMFRIYLITPRILSLVSQLQHLDYDTNSLLQMMKAHACRLKTTFQIYESDVKNEYSSLNKQISNTRHSQLSTLYPFSESKENDNPIRSQSESYCSTQVQIISNSRQSEGIFYLTQYKSKKIIVRFEFEGLDASKIELVDVCAQPVKISLLEESLNKPIDSDTVKKVNKDFSKNNEDFIKSMANYLTIADSLKQKSMRELISYCGVFQNQKIYLNLFYPNQPSQSIFLSDSLSIDNSDLNIQMITHSKSQFSNKCGHSLPIDLIKYSENCMIASLLLPDLENLSPMSDPSIESSYELPLKIRLNIHLADGIDYQAEIYKTLHFFQFPKNYSLFKKLSIKMSLNDDEFIAKSLTKNYDLIIERPNLDFCHISLKLCLEYYKKLLQEYHKDSTQNHQLRNDISDCLQLFKRRLTFFEKNEESNFIHQNPKLMRKIFTRRQIRNSQVTPLKETILENLNYGKYSDNHTGKSQLFVNGENMLNTSKINENFVEMKGKFLENFVLPIKDFFIESNSAEYSLRGKIDKTSEHQQQNIDFDVMSSISKPTKDSNDKFQSIRLSEEKENNVKTANSHSPQLEISCASEKNELVAEKCNEEFLMMKCKDLFDNYDPKISDNSEKAEYHLEETNIKDTIFIDKTLNKGCYDLLMEIEQRLLDNEDIIIKEAFSSVKVPSRDNFFSKLLSDNKKSDYEEDFKELEACCPQDIYLQK